MVDPQPVSTAAAALGRSHPVVPFAWEAFREQHTATDREARERDDSFLPCAVDGLGHGPTRAVIFHECDVHGLVRAKPAQPDPKLIRRYHRSEEHTSELQ